MNNSGGPRQAGRGMERKKKERQSERDVRKAKLFEQGTHTDIVASFSLAQINEVLWNDKFLSSLRNEIDVGTKDDRFIIIGDWLRKYSLTLRAIKGIEDDENWRCI